MNIMDVLSSASYSDIISTTAMIVAVIAVPASGYLSYHYAIKGERRKEFNAAADPIRQKLREQIRLVNLGYYPGDNVAISDTEFEQLIDVYEKKRHKVLMLSWRDYQSALKLSCEYDEDNFFKFTDPERLLNAIDDFLPIADRR